MQRLEGYLHRTGEHAGSATLRNLAEHYEWEFAGQLDEAACFGIGAGLGFALFDPDDRPGRGFVGRTSRLERAFFEHLDVPHAVHEGEPFEDAWTDVARRLDGGDPVVLFLDPASIEGVAARHRFDPYAALAVGYGDDGVLVSLPHADEPAFLSFDTLREAWRSQQSPFEANYHLVVTDSRPGSDLETAASRALRETTEFMLDPMTSPHGSDDPDHYGVPGIRMFAATMPEWTDLENPEHPLRAARHAVDGRGTAGGAFRYRFASALESLAPRTAVGGGLADRMRDIADDWAAVADALEKAGATDDEATRSRHLEEASSRLVAVAGEEEELFGHVREELD